jgi:hypothetical protein
MSHAKELACHFVPVATAGVGALLLVLAVAHALLRTFLEDRGVRPWTLRDSLGATPVLLLGALLLGAAGGLLAPWCHGTVALGAGCAIPRGTILLALALAAVGALAVRLGLLALRKLT